MVEYISKNGSNTKSNGENKDCAVRAVAAAFDVSYDQAHEFAQLQWSRKRGRGTNTPAIINTMDRLASPNLKVSKEGKITPMNTLFGKVTKQANVINEYPTKHGLVKCKSKLSTFANKNRKGTYYVLVNKHATVVKDGIVLDNYAPGSTVKYAWKIEDAK